MFGRANDTTGNVCALIFSARVSIINLKIRGDRGHPCLVPLEMLNGLDSMEEQYTWAEGREQRAIIAEKIYLGFFCNVITMYLQCTWLNAFSASKDRSREGALCLPAWCKMLIIRRVASEV